MQELQNKVGFGILIKGKAMKGFQGVVIIILLVQTFMVGLMYLSVLEMQEDLSIYLDIYEIKFNDVINSVDNV